MQPKVETLKPYKAPVLTVYGSAAVLTAAGKTSPAEPSGGKQATAGG